MPTEVDDRGRITIPKEERERLGIKPGSKVQLRREERGLVIEKSTTQKELIKELKGCIKVPTEEKITPESIKTIWEKEKK